MAVNPMATSSARFQSLETPLCIPPTKSQVDLASVCWRRQITCVYVCLCESREDLKEVCSVLQDLIVKNSQPIILKFNQQEFPMRLNV